VGKSVELENQSLCGHVAMAVTTVEMYLSRRLQLSKMVQQMGKGDPAYTNRRYKLGQRADTRAGGSQWRPLLALRPIQPHSGRLQSDLTLQPVALMSM
jgi:hypothetical protein